VRDEQTEPHGAGAPDVGDYCRKVEECLARVNHGHLIRIVGPAFELVRGWALSGVPLGVVYRGIEDKAERHRSGRSKRPLRLEFCETDVRALFDQWRRAVGVQGEALPADASASSPVIEERRRPSVVRQLDRAADKLVRAAGRLEMPEPFRAEAARILEELASIRERARLVRGGSRRALLADVARLDRELAAAARQAAGDSLADAEAEAAADLAPYRQRLGSEAWRHSLDASVDRTLRDRFGLPTLDFDIPTS
jgi:hypothetical protein